MIETNVKKEQQQLHSLLPLTLPSTNNPVDCLYERKGGRRPDEGADAVRSYTLETAKGGQQSLHSFTPWGEGQDEGADKSALTQGATAKDTHDSFRHPELVSGSSQAASLEDMTPHQVRTKLAKRSLSPTILSPKGEEFHDRAHHEAEEPASCKFLITQSLSHLITSKAAAFTLAEVLITLAVIGIVAALTLPGLIQNHNEKAWSTAKDLWEKKLTETVRRMNTDGVMTGHDTTEDFMNSFKQYMKVIKTCDNTDINKCYSPKVVTTGSNEEPMEVETDSLTSASSMGLSDWQTNTNTMSFVVADGTTVIMAYQPECPYADPIEDTGSQVSCMGYMVDVNGKKGPNRVGKDIQLSSGVAFSTCDNPIGDMCWSTEFAPTAINTCDDTTYDPSGSSNTYCSTNYWAGAIKSCKDKGMELPTRAQLAQLASELYVNASDGSAVTIGANEYKDNLKVKDEYKDNPPITLANYWSSEDYDAYYAYRWYFDTTDTGGGDGYWEYKDISYPRAVCISN